MNNIKLSASYQAEEPERIVRLTKVVDFIKEIRPALLNKIDRLHDHKGELRVELNTNEIEISDVELIKTAWESVNEYNLIFALKNLPHEFN
jgi:hypothetical protein